MKTGLTGKIRRALHLVEDRTTCLFDTLYTYTIRIVAEDLAVAIPFHRNGHLSNFYRFNPRLCRHCQEWNNPKNPFQWGTYPFSEDGFVSLQRILRSKHCVVCRVVGAMTLEHMRLMNQDIPEISKIRAHMGPLFLIPEGVIEDKGRGVESYVLDAVRTGKPVKCVLYFRFHSAQEDPGRPATNGDCFSPPSLGIQLVLAYRRFPLRLTLLETWDTPYFDIQLVKSWISRCETDHEASCNNIQGTLPTEFRLIDVEKLCIVATSHSPNFVALSYMWNEDLAGMDSHLCRDNLDRLQKPGAIDLAVLPGIIADAVELCKSLGRRFLWIDRLCIVQDDSSSKYSQINAMDSIYGMAALTLVAAVDRHRAPGLPGMPNRPRPSFLRNGTRRFEVEGGAVDTNFHDVVNASAWNKRGWTFQERLLSLRCLYITEYQVYFSCPQMKCQEEMGRKPTRDTKTHWELPRPGVFWVRNIRSLEEYLEIVSLYTARQLSYETDVLSAFAGVSNIMSKQMETRFFFGLPEKYFQLAILWQNRSRARIRHVVSQVPSWSWAAWLGPVNYKHLANSSIAAWDTGTLVKFHIQDSDRGLLPLDFEETWFGTSKDFSDSTCLDKDKIVESYMISASASASIWKDCPHNPWERSKRICLDSQACHLAQKHPGCLVFNTTVASLFLKKSAIDSIRKTASTDSEADMVSLDLCDKKLNKIGYMQLDRPWMEQKVNLDGKSSFIILCGHLLRKSERRSFFDLDARPYFPTGSPWLLRGMLVERHQGVTRRLGLGFVETTFWRQAEPKWETIVLT